MLTEPDSRLPLIVVGAHLDSVPEGPGINDNGSGSAAVLEAALVLANTFQRTPANVQFAFWGAEERGLVGMMPGRVTFVIDKEGVIRDRFESLIRFKTHVQNALKLVKTL